MTFAERRECERQSVDLDAKISFCSLDEKNDWSSYSASVRDLSKKGLSVKLKVNGDVFPRERLIGTNSRKETRVAIPQVFGQRVLNGQRIWVTGDVKCVRLGIRLESLSVDDLAVLHSYITQRIQEESYVVEFKRLRKLYDSDSVTRKADVLAAMIGRRLHHIKACTYDSNHFKGNIENPIGVVQIPLGIAGPVLIKGEHAKGSFWVPMATTEGALVLTYDLGMRLLRMSGPIDVKVISKVIHITAMFPIRDKEDLRIANYVDKNYERIKSIAESDSKHLTLLKIEQHHTGKTFLLKFLYDTDDAHGLNMINHATFRVCKHIEESTGAFFYHRSHFSGVKHHSLLNEKEGYGRVVKASAVVSHKALNMLGVTAQAMEDFGNRCIDSGYAANISSVNVHAANAIAAIFLACGQDPADLISSGVCSSHCEAISNGRELYVESILRNLLVGTVGGGTGLGTQSECLAIMGCLGAGGSDKFAELIGAAVLSGEFTTAAAVVNRSYVDIHNKYGRNKNKLVE